MRRPTGQFYEWRTKAGTTSYGVRFRYCGQRRFVTLGSSRDGMSRNEAKTAMANLMADVRRGLWVPPDERQPDPRPTPTFHEFASEWYAALCEEGGSGGRGLSESGRSDLLWRLSNHLLPYFAAFRLDAIGVEDVDRYRRAKVEEGRLSPSSINKTLQTLSAILEVGVEYGHVDRNVAKGRRRRLKTSKPRRTYLTRPGQIAALLEAAATLDQRGRTGNWRRPLLSVLLFAGLRISEALDLEWRDLDLANGRLRVRGTKTDAATRTVELLPALRDEMLAFAAAQSERPRCGRIFTTARGRRILPGNVRQRVLQPAVVLANAVIEGEEEPIPDRLTPHSLRRTFASLLVALGRDPAVVMKQMGHTTPAFTLSTYAAAMDWNDGERARLRALVEGEEWQETGNTPAEPQAIAPDEAAA